MKNYKVTALLPMKEHSKRLPNKNIKLLGDKPLFWHILDNLELSKYITEIIVSTDSAVIKTMIMDNYENIEVVDLPTYLVEDGVTLTPVIEYTLEHIKNHTFLQVHATSPFLSSATIDSGIVTYFEVMKDGFDSLMGVNSYQTRFYDNKRNPINHEPSVRLLSQYMPKIYEDNSALYITSVKNFKKTNSRAGINPYFMEIPKLESIDIDTAEDFIIAEALYSFCRKRGNV